MIAKVAYGLADDFVACTALATKAPLVMAPAMNDAMFLNPVVQENISRLKKRGVVFVPPKKGRLACGTVGVGALADVDVIVKEVVDLLK
jgi:phosphopantothenoylcysteine decarboxylase/phosphopantothenate--cysteine ligase